MYITIPEIDDTARYIDYSELFKPEIKPMNKDKVLAELKSSPAYKLFYETYPDTGEEFRFHGKGGEMDLATMNYEKNNLLLMELSYEWYYNDGEYFDYIESNIWCDLNIPNARHIEAEGAMVLGFIKYGYCLDLGPDISDTVCREGYTLHGTECIPILHDEPPYYPEINDGYGW